MSSPWKSAVDSPSRQLLWELSRLGVSSQEDFYARLDRETLEREKVHKKALAAAAAEHEKIREGAELARRELEQQVQNERRRRDEEQRRDTERRRQEEVERMIEEKKLLEKEKAKTAALEAKRAEQEERIRKAESEAAAQAQKAEKERQAIEAAAQARKEQKNEELQRRLAEAKPAQQEPSTATQSAPDTTLFKSQPTVASTPAAPTQAQSALTPQRESEHQGYLIIHRKLKELRKFMAAEGAKSPELKTNMGDLRRQIRKSIGQLRVGTGVNKVPLQNIINAFRSALKAPSPQIPISPFLFSLPSLPSDASTTGPSLLLYLFNMFSKFIVTQLISEAGIETHKADPIGTIASHIFALKDFLWNDHTLIDILIAKFHVSCPVLFGIYGPSNTAAGKVRVGWARGISRHKKGDTFISLQDHSQRMAGLGAGFAAISLRNYEKTILKNPYPATNYWIAFANILNVPAGQRGETHAMVLKAMIEGYEERFLLFFGDAARCALRLAVRDYGKGVQGGGMATKALEILGDVALRERKIRI